MPFLTETAAAERRVAPRKFYRGDISMHMSNGQILPAVGIDLSASGLGLSCPMNLPKKLKCELRFALTMKDDETHSLKVSAVVAYSVLSGQYGKFKVGVQFADISPATAKLLDTYINGHL